ncbi:recombination protein RecR [Candidatus Uhrbacteria bacterium]|nr:recombination protein RecR [Candidatus Uhrbacteria bacterium]
MAKFPRSIELLIEQFRKLPGVGPKTAERFALSIARKKTDDVEALIAALRGVERSLVTCTTCHTITEVSPCTLCTDPRRDDAILCVVAEPQDLLAIEKSAAFHGRYHVLGGVLSPIEGVTPEQLKIKELVTRITESPAFAKASAGKQNHRITEVIIALDPNIEGEATTIYLKKLLRPLNVTVTRLARGLPLGADIEYADDITIADALSGRRVV